jgi:hypothetical protein
MMNDSADRDPGARDPTRDATSSSIAQPDERQAKAVELWTPRGIGWASVLLGYPGALVLAALNWRRMDQTRKAIVHLMVAVAGTAVLFLPKVGSIGLLVGIVVGYYLYRVQRSDQSSFARADQVAERNGLLGAVIAIVFTVAIVGLGVAVSTVATGSEAADRGHVLFGTAAGTDVCSPRGQTNVFGPADPIFLAAIMRETVQPGSHVVYEIDGPGATAGPFPVTLTPPYDCLGTKQPIGPLDPGTYVIRYRYDLQPATAELATGTFTVGVGSGPSVTP